MPYETHSNTAGKTERSSFWWRYLLLTLLCVLLIPVVVLGICLLAAGYSPVETLQGLLAQLQAERRNLLVVGLPALLPFALLALVLLIYRRWRGPSGCWQVALAGSVAIVTMLVWANASFWPLFLPGRSYPGWPHGLEMVIVPLFFAPVGMLIAVAIALILQGKR